MVTIITDSSCMMTVEEGAKNGVVVNPLSVTIDNKTYLDLVEIDSKTFVNIINQGHIPTSSQPSVGRTLEIYEAHKDTPILNLTMAYGLSGTYATAMGAVEAVEFEHEEIRVVNTKTIWANQAYIIGKAVEYSREGLSIDEIMERLNPSLETAISYLIPSDFDYLKRGGRLAPFAANIGGLLKLMPVLFHSKDGMVIEKYSMSRGLKSAVSSVIKGFNKSAIDEHYIISISHAEAPDYAEEAYALVKKAFPENEVNIHALSPGMITQGGPKCIAIQAIRKIM